MANKPLKSLTFPDLTDTYTIPETLFESGTGNYSVEQITIDSDNLTNLASGNYAVAFGENCVASGIGSFAGGIKSTASGTGSVAVGQKLSSGNSTTASGNGSVAMGASTEASGTYSVAMGQKSVASGNITVAIGNYALSTGRACTVLGQANVEDTNAIDTTHGAGARKYILIVGNGLNESSRSNALTVDWDGNLVAAGKMTVGIAPTADMDVATKKYVDDNSGGGATEVFWATYGTTTSAQLEEAYQAEKEILVAYNSRIYRLSLRESAQYHVFTAFAVASNNLYCYLLYCNSNSWSSGNVMYPKTSETTVSTDGAVSQALDAGKLYHFTGAVTSLTITFNAAIGGEPAHYHFDFNSGSTAPTLTLPNTVTMPSGFSVEASKHYEIDILNGYGTVMAW